MSTAITHRLKLEQHLRDGIPILETRDSSEHGTDRNCITVDSRAMELLVENEEVALAMRKKFKGKRTMYGEPKFSDLVLWCMSTSSYSVCERNFADVSNQDIARAWEFIDTTTVSSTASTRAMMLEFKLNRSATGFKRLNFEPIAFPPPGRLLDRNCVPNVLVQSSMKENTGNTSMEEVLIEDCMYWIERSRDPLVATLKLRSTLLQRNKGFKNSEAHRG